MGRSQKWPDLRSPISKIRYIRFVGTDDLIIFQCGQIQKFRGKSTPKRNNNDIPKKLIITSSRRFCRYLQAEKYPNLAYWGQYEVTSHWLSNVMFLTSLPLFQNSCKTSHKVTIIQSSEVMVTWAGWKWNWWHPAPVEWTAFCTMFEWLHWINKWPCLR